MNSKKLAEKYPDVANDEEIYNVTESRRLTERGSNNMATNESLKINWQKSHRNKLHQDS